MQEMEWNKRQLMKVQMENKKGIRVGKGGELPNVHIHLRWL